MCARAGSQRSYTATRLSWYLLVGCDPQAAHEQLSCMAHMTECDRERCVRDRDQPRRVVWTRTSTAPSLAWQSGGRPFLWAPSTYPGLVGGTRMSQRQPTHPHHSRHPSPSDGVWHKCAWMNVAKGKKQGDIASATHPIGIFAKATTSGTRELEKALVGRRSLRRSRLHR